MLLDDELWGSASVITFMVLLEESVGWRRCSALTSRKKEARPTSRLVSAGVASNRIASRARVIIAVCVEIVGDVVDTMKE